MVKYIDITEVFTALCSKTRLKIMELLGEGEKCADRLLKHVNIGQSTLSHHMKILIESGLVSARKAGKWTYYSVCENNIQFAVEKLKNIKPKKPK